MSKHSRDRVVGEIFIFTPISWQLLGYGSALVLLIAGVFICTAEYARTEVVAGVVAPDKGVTAISPSRAGTVTRLHVANGQDVNAGDLVAAVKVEEDVVGERSAAAEVQAAAERQNMSAIAQLEAVRNIATAQQAQLDAEMSAIRAEILQISSQVSLQEELVRSAEDELGRSTELVNSGFNSRRDLSSKREALFLRKQQLAQLSQVQLSKSAALNDAKKRSILLRAQSASQEETIKSLKAQLDGQVAVAQAARSYVVRAPVAGRITALTAFAGQHVSNATQLGAIIPKGARLRVEMAIPSAAIGFVEAGQRVRVSVDAFPVQRFGTVDGVIETVSEQSVVMDNSAKVPVVAYPTYVRLATDSMSLFGKRQPLVSGMTVTARIVTRKQSLFAWLFEPFFAVQRR